MNGKIHCTTNGFLSYEIFDAKQEDIYKLGDVLLKHFQFKPCNAPIIGLDNIFWEFSNGAVRLTAGWDIWSGCFVMSHCLAGDKFINELAEKLTNTRCKGELL